MPERNHTTLPADFRLVLSARLDGDTLLGGDPFTIARLRPSSLARVRAWIDGAPVGEGGALARALVMANLAQPIPTAFTASVSVVIPVRDRSISRLLAALAADEVIVVDDASHDGDSVRAEAENAGARYIRRQRRGGAAAARNDGLAAASNDLVALLDSDTVPQPGWLEPLLAHFADPVVDVVAPRIVALADEDAPRGGGDGGEARGGDGDGGEARGGPRGLAGAISRYEARRSPLDRGPDPARVVARGRVPFVPGAALVVRRHLRFDEAFDQGGEDVDLVRRAGYVRYEPQAKVAHDHRTDPRKWLQRRVYYGRTAAPLAVKHPDHARPLYISPWTTAAWVAVAARRPLSAAAITATATGLLARELPLETAAALAGLGTLNSGRVVADALARAWWPASLAAAATLPKTRLPIAAAFAVSSHGSALKLADDLAFGYGVWSGCISHRTLEPIRPSKPWKIVRRTL